MKKILLTGGLGFIGSHTAVALIENDFEVFIVDDLSNSKIEIKDRIHQITNVNPHFFLLDIRNFEGLKNIFKQQQFDAIIHFAAKKSVEESVKNPLLYYDVNINSVLNLLKLMNDFNVNNMIFSSSCTIYGQPDKLPVNETTPYKPASSPYGFTKQIGEEMLRNYCFSNSKIKNISLRYFNPVGAHYSALIGELPLDSPSNLVPFLTQTAAGIRKCLNIFGKDYNTPDGTAIRDYIHVVDLANAHVIALKRLLNNKNIENYEYFNIGTGKGYSVLDVVKSFEENTGVKLNYQFKDRRLGDIEKIYSDTKKANEILGWKAEKNLAEMVTSAWAWQKSI